MNPEKFPGSASEARPDVRQLLLKGSYQEALKVSGEDAVRGEIDEMIFRDLANYALKAAIALKFDSLAKNAARVIENSGGYDNESQQLAQSYLGK